MKPYDQYTVEDFLRDEEFRDWVQGLSRQEAFWIAFGENHPEQLNVMQQAEQMIRAAHIEEEHLSEKEIRSEVDKFLAIAGNVSAPDAEQTDSSQKQARWRRLLSAQPWLAAAALVVGVVGLAWLLAPANAPRGSVSSLVLHRPDGLTETTNPTQHPLHLMLSDSSEVILSPGSTLCYPDQFPDSARMVYLTGEASFSVTHRGQPFLVRTGDMTTRVLGTRFVVTAYPRDPKISVQVLSGKVSVYRSGSGAEAQDRKVNGLILTANQAAIFEKDLHHLTKTLVADPVLVVEAPQHPEQRYDEVALPEILHQLEQQYGIAIQFDQQSLKNCRITATLANETLYEKLDMLCKTVSARYQIVDGQILISGRGCF